MYILDPDYCPVVAEYKRILQSRGQSDARRYLVNEMRNGHRSDTAVRALLDIADPDIKTPRGRRAGSHLDPVWQYIGADFGKLVQRGTPREKAYQALADEYGASERTIRKLVADYHKDMREVWQAQEEWEREYDNMTEEERDQFWSDATQHNTQPPADDFDLYHQKRQAAIRRAEESCPHDCREGCRRQNLLADRYKCPLSPSPLQNNGDFFS